MLATKDFRLAVLTAAAMAVLASPAAAKETAPLWHKTCAKAGGKTDCFVEQFTMIRNHGRTVPILHTRMDFDGAGKDKARILLTTPLGVLLPAGLHLSIDGGKPFALPFDRCDRYGCTAIANLNQSATLKLERGRTLMVRFVVTPKVAPDIPVRLQGLAAALRSLRK